MENKFSFTVQHKDIKTRARVGEIHTPHGVIHTPQYVPVGTQAAVKSLTPDELKQLGVELFFVNTYHVYLRPGLGIIDKFDGLHRFMNWPGPLITDSGGFQVFSLGTKKLVNIAISESAVLDREKFTQKLSRKDGVKDQIYPDDYRPIGELVKIDEEGVTFTSHWDGSQHRFTPEVSMNLQHRLGSDIMIAFDECTTYPTTHAYAAAALARTHRWAIRSLDAHRKVHSPPANEAGSKFHVQSKKIKHSTSSFDLSTVSYQALYGVVQGSVFKDLRRASARFVAGQDFDGVAIGGVSVGESKEEMRHVLEWVVPELPQEKPRHLLGVGEIDDIFVAVEQGMDTFDCVQPTRLARMGHLFVCSKSKVRSSKFTIDITKKEFSGEIKPIDTDCKCYMCINYTRGYLHHLFRVKELLAYRLATIHNVYYVISLTAAIRKHLLEGTYPAFKKAFFADNTQLL